MSCEICGRSVIKDGVSLYRINEYGIKGKWACEAHIHLFPKKLSALDEDSLELCELISGNKIIYPATGGQDNETK